MDCIITITSPRLHRPKTLPNVSWIEHFRMRAALLLR